MKSYILVVGNILVLLGYTIMILLYVKFRKIKSKHITGFDQAKDITRDYDNINIIESREVFISHYYFKRDIIRLTPKMYYANDLFSLAVITFLSSISFVHDSYFRRILSKVDYINKSPFVMVIISYFIHYKMDAYIGIVLGSIILFYQYFYLQLVAEGVTVAKNKKNQDIVKILEYFYKANTIFFISSLVFLLRFILIILK